MNFDFSEEQKLLQKTARDYLDDNSNLAVNREVLETDGLVLNADLWKSAAEMGWLGAVIPEEYGGAGFGHLEMALIAEEIGRSLAPIPFGSSVFLAAEAILEGGSAEQRKNYLPGLADGTLIGTAALAEGRGALTVDGIDTSYASGKISGTKIAVADGNAANVAIVAAKSPKGPVLVAVDLNGAGVTKTPHKSIDPTRSCATIEFKNASADLLGSEGGGWTLLENVLDRAAVLTAFEQVGGAQAAFDLTHAQILGRYAFGRPIGSFQAVKHRMADLYAALQIARSNCYYGAWALENESDELGIAACNSRIAASQAFDLSAVEMIQFYGGVGYTWEYDCHLFYRRAKHLSVVLGSPAVWKEKLIERLVAKQAA